MSISTVIRTLFLSGLLSLAHGLQAHEFWFAPITSPQAVGDSVTLRLEVGELFIGEPAGFSIPTSRALRHFSSNILSDLRPFLPSEALEAEVAVVLDTPGTHLMAYDSAPLRITLEPGKFHAYLHEEGLDFVKTQREQAGTANQSARERYRRHIKTMVDVGPLPQTERALDRTYATQVGQRLEITPACNPLALAAGDALPLTILFDGKPLIGALVKAWHKHNDQLVVIRATTSPQGQVTFNLPYTGDWMVSVVHMIPAQDAEDGVDWDSFWGNLTFHVAGTASAKPCTFWR